MKFGQLIEYNISNIFLEKSYTKCGRKTIPRVVRYVIGRVLKGHIYPTSQIASHMQVNPSINRGSLFMSRAITGTSSG